MICKPIPTAGSNIPIITFARPTLSIWPSSKVWWIVLIAEILFLN
jgi:hypothetical protein